MLNDSSGHRPEIESFKFVSRKLPLEFRSSDPGQWATADLGQADSKDWNPRESLKPSIAQAHVTKWRRRGATDSLFREQ
jgi:hypothetical protein